jgi:hypothetical protein
MDQLAELGLPGQCRPGVHSCDVMSELLRVDARPGRSVAAQLSEGEAMRGQHHAGTKTSGRNAGAVVSVVVVTLLIVLVVVILLVVG